MGSVEGTVTMPVGTGAIVTTLDLRGLSCPMPIAKTAKAMRALAPGALLEAIATDPGSVPDFTAWCRNTGNELVEQTSGRGVYRFLIRKA